MELIRCAKCGYQAEIFSDEMKVKCPKCRGAVSREKPPSCLDWCKSVRQCQGYENKGKGNAK